MNVEIGRFTIYSDSQCMWITEEKPNTRAKKATSDEFVENRVAGYSRNWEQLMVSFLENGYRSSDAKSVKELLKEMDDRERQIKKFVKEATKGLKQNG